MFGLNLKPFVLVKWKISTLKTDLDSRLIRTVRKIDGYEFLKLRLSKISLDRTVLSTDFCGSVRFGLRAGLFYFVFLDII